MSPKHCLDNRPERSRSERAEMRREAARLRRMQRHILFVALIMLLALGVVSVSFSYFSQEYLKPTDGGSLIFEMRTAAAKRDLADTGANVELAETGAGQYNMNWQAKKVYFVVPDSWDLSSYSHVQVDLTRTTSASESNYQCYIATMTRVGTSRIYQATINADHSGWNRNEYLAFTANSSDYGTGTFALNGNHYYTTPKDYGMNNSSNYYLALPDSDANGCTVSMSYNSDRDTLMKRTQTANVYTDGVSSSTGGSVSLTGYYFTSDTAISTSSASPYDAVISTTMTMTAEENDGYEFDGWYSDSSCTTLLSSNSEYSYTVWGANTVYANFTTITDPDITTITPGADSLNLGETSTITTVLANTSSPTVTYTSSDDSILSVTKVSNTSATIKALAPGSATITATLTDGATTVTKTTSSITVNSPVVSFKYGTGTNDGTTEAKAYPIYAGTTSVAATVSTTNVHTGDGATVSYSYSIGDATYGSVDSDGKITANTTPIASATVTVTAMVSYNSVSYTTDAVTAYYKVYAYYLLGFRNTISDPWTKNSANMMTPDTDAGWYAINRTLYAGSKTYGSGGNWDTDEGFKVVYYDGTTSSYYGNSGTVTATITKATLNSSSSTWVYSTDVSKNARLKTKDCSLTTNSAVYKFYFKESTKQLAVYYPVKITYDAGSGNFSGSRYSYQAVAYNGTATRPASDPTSTGYDFTNWVTSSGGSTAFSFTSARTADATAYAKWTASSYAVTLHTNDGTINSGNVTSYTYGTGATLPTDISKDNCDFIGWYANSDLSGSKVTSISTTATGAKEYWAKWRERTPWILTFVIDDDSDLEINGSTTMTATYRYPLTGDAIRIDAAKGGASYNDYFDISYVTPAPVNGVYTCTATVTALKDCSDVTFTASLLTSGSTRGETMTAEDDLTVTTPSISDTTAITLYPDQTSGVTKTVTSVDPASVTSIKYYNHGVLSETGNNYASVFTVGETTGTITPVAQTTNNAPAAAALYVVVEYNGSYSKQFKRTVNLVQRSVFLPGTGDWSYTGTNNLMSYNWETGLYEKTKNLSYSESTYEFKVYHTDGGTWYGKSNTTLTSADNTVKLDDGNNVKLTTKDLSSITSSNVPYLFTYNYTSHDLVANYPVTVAYNKNGHGADADVPATTVKQYGSTLTQPSPLTASGWTFGGWYKEAGCTNQWNFGTDTVTADTTLHAKWTPMTSALTFVINGTGLLHTPSGSMPTNKTATVGSAMPSITGAGDPTLPTCTGYNFDGYYDAASGGNRYYDENGESARVWDKNTPNGEGTTLYAHWTLKTTTVTFSMNTQDTEGETLIGTPAAMSTVTATYGSAMPSINAPSLNGYTFLGFCDTGGTQYYNANGSSAHNWDKEDAACTLTAKWQINTYTVQFIAVYRSGSTTWSSSDTLTPESGVLTGAGTYKYHQNITLTARDTVSGYTLNGIRSGFNTSGPTITPSGDNNYVQTNTGYLSSNVIYYAYYTRDLAATLTITPSITTSGNPTTMDTLAFSSTVAYGTGGATGPAYSYLFNASDNDFSGSGSPTTIPPGELSAWKAPDVGWYKFIVAYEDSEGNIATAEQVVHIVKNNTYFTISTNAAADSEAASVTYTQIDTYLPSNDENYSKTVTTSVLGGTTLKMNVVVGEHYYISSVTVNGAAVSPAANRNTSLTDYVIATNVTGNVAVVYDVREKPTVTITAVDYEQRHELAYTLCGSSVTVNPASEGAAYHVDYATSVTYTVVPQDTHYITGVTSTPSGFTVSMPSPAEQAAATCSSVIYNYTLETSFQLNPKVYVDQPEFGSIWVTNSAGTAYYLDGEPVPYGTVLKVHVAPNHATSSEYDGSTYHHYHYYDISGVTATAEDESVSSLTTITTGSQSENVYTHTIEGDTTYSAVITHFTDGTSTTIDTVKKMMSESVPLGYRRIFFTDIYDFAGYSSNNASGEYDLYAHYSLDSGDYGSLTPDPENEGEYLDVDSVRMTYLYKNGQSQKVYYATIPAGARYVSFTNHTVDTDVDPVLNEELGVNVYRTTKYTASYTLFSDKNAFYPGSLAASSTSEYESGNRYWQCHYADIRTVPYTEEAGVYTAGAQYAQQASTGLNRPVEFSFLYDNPYSTGTDGYLEATKVYGDAVDIRFTNTGVRITPTELSAGYSLVKIKSKASLVEKYYLIRIYPVEIKRFDQLQKLFNSSTVSSLTFNMIARGVELSYQFLSSLHNNNDYTEMTSASGIVADVDEMINEITYAVRYLTVNYSDYQFLGMQYFQARITGSGQTDTKEQHTVFDLDSGTADGVLYFKNATRLSVEDIHVKVVARFTTGSDYTWVTMQELDSDNHELLRTPIPTGATSVQFYLMYEDKYSADMASMSPAYYYARSADLSIRAGKMFRVTSLYSMSGSYVNFRQ